MTYAGSFHRLVMIGSLFDDSFNVTLSIVPTGGATTLGAVTDPLITGVADAVSGWWDNPLTASQGIDLSAAAKLVSVKLNRIGPDGKYMDPVKEKILTTPVSGGSGVANMGPAQLSIAATLRGANPRARAGKGRMYFPVSALCVSNLGTDGRVSTVNAKKYSDAVAFLLARIGDAYFTAGVAASPGIASRQGAGAFQSAREVTVGRVVDTVRSRRNKLAEDFVTTVL